MLSLNEGVMDLREEGLELEKGSMDRRASVDLVDQIFLGLDWVQNLLPILLILPLCLHQGYAQSSVNQFKGHTRLQE